MGKWLLAVLLTHAADPRTELVLLGPDGSTVLSAFEHVPDGSVHGRLLPGSRAAMVVADRSNAARDISFSGTLLRLEPGKAPLAICDRVVHASTPLVTSDGRVFVERGRADELTIEEAAAGAMRVVWRGRGYASH